LVIAPQVSQQLDQLADTLATASVRCLIGVVDGDSATIDLAWEPPSRTLVSDDSSSSRRVFGACPLATIVMWRSRPWSGDGRPEDACFLTRDEIEEALRPRAPAVQFVQVNARVACWWTQRQIARAAGMTVLLPIPGQHRPRHIAIGPDPEVRVTLLATAADDRKRWGERRGKSTDNIDG
jgi:hypothetical protein